jgi:hypothetical protein
MGSRERPRASRDWARGSKEWPGGAGTGPGGAWNGPGGRDLARRREMAWEKVSVGIWMAKNGQTAHCVILYCFTVSQ